MEKNIASTGFWLSDEDLTHVYIPELSAEINKYIKEHNIKNIYDFGCGHGEYLHEAVKKYPDLEAIGFEGYMTDGIFNNIVKQDLSIPLNLPKVDLVLSIEVGEHIPVEFENIFLDNLTKSTKKHLILSWAIEGQHGDGHVNCRNNDYIIEQITKRGFEFDVETTKSMRKNMPADIWIFNTLMVFKLSS